MARQPRRVSMSRLRTLSLAWTVSVLCTSLPDSAPAAEPSGAPSGWQARSPREEIRPEFDFGAKGGRDGKGSLVMRGGGNEGVAGQWEKAFAVEGGRWYRFKAFWKADGVAAPRRSVLSRILWRGGDGRAVLRDTPGASSYRDGPHPVAEPEYPADGARDSAGWTEVSGVYQAPSKAVKAVVELHLRWAPGGRVEWSEVSLAETAAPPERKVRLAAVHFRPRGKKTAAENCLLFDPLIEEAARQKADLVVLPETLTYCSTDLPFAEVAESVPGPSSDHFAGLAKKHRLYVVAGLVER